MVEINNQRKAFLDMLAWSEGTDNGRQKTRNQIYDVIVGGKLFTDYSDHPRKLVTLNPNSNQQAPGRQLLSRWWDAYRKQLGLKDFSPKSQDAVALQQIRAWRFTYDWSWWYPSGNRPLQQYLGFTAGRWLWSVQARAAAWLQEIQRRRNGQEIDVWAESPRLSPLWLSASSSACHGLLIITVLTHYLQSPARQKCQRTEAGERGNYWHADASAWCAAALDAKYTKELADAKAENDALRDDVAAGRRRLRHQSSLSVSAWSHHRLRRG